MVVETLSAQTLSCPDLHRLLLSVSQLIAYIRIELSITASLLT